MRTFTGTEFLERALVKRFRKELWQPCIAAVKRYGLLSPGDRVAVPMDGTGPALVMAKLLQEIHRHTDFPFEAAYFAPPEAMDAAEAAGVPAQPLEAYRPEAFTAVAAPDCMTDAVETVLAGMLYRGELAAFLPRETRPEGGFLIRPLYCAERRDIRAWHRYCGLKYVPSPAESDPARGKVRALLEEQRRENPNVEISVFRALHAVHLDTFRAFTEP
ncbi:MAG: hypothetical protein IKH77_05845 [Clostridia bacterium]|nr:hypothetical protein [Clostridia bacterium]